jgi:hypothetical protein
MKVVNLTGFTVFRLSDAVIHGAIGLSSPHVD